MPGRHSLPRKPRRKLAPFATATVATAVLVGGGLIAAEVAAEPQHTDATATAGESTASPPSPKVTDAAARREAPQRPSRGNRNASAPSPTGTPAVLDSGTCKASFYDEPQGTANGETFDPDALTAAHKSLKFDTRVRVTNVANGKSVVVRINDRGPYIAGRCLDLSRAAFAEIANLGSGVTTVRYDILA
ncbi:septal ring lytic transglycosylase RlpA family protein [Catellatospora sichuanensis]|uniref:septal ring lytic transglycosylase RlpA family protein n=1 Tax=Catellatospora sichuanensis TaxID=1969805 RepID=UPI001FE48FA9|nr:septal ring lytic transglycosylase RlpA family protein [Catellatospora sichuanensis]